jgi:hypothetical protein
VLEREPGAGATGAGLDLVDDEQRAVRAVSCAPRGEYPPAAGDTRLALDGLDEQRRDAVVHRRFERLDRRRGTRRPGIGRNGSACTACR